MSDEEIEDEEPIPFTPEELEEARRYSLVIEWSPRDEAYLVSVPELPGLHTHGATREEALAMGEDAVAVWLAGLRATGRPVPSPRYAVVPA